MLMKYKYREYLQFDEDGVFVSVEFQTNDLVLLLIKYYLNVLKLFPVACRYGWHGGKCIAT